MKTIGEEKQWSKVVEKEGEALLKYYGNAQKIHSEKWKPDNTFHKPEVVVLWGPTGVGKSRLARTYSENYYVKTAIHEKWWDGYDNEDTIIWDDFRGGDVKFTMLLTLLDGYRKQVQFKGGFHYLKPKRWIITSCKPAEQWYTGQWMTDENINQLLRRITTQLEFKEPIKFTADNQPIIADSVPMGSAVPMGSGNTRPTPIFN